MIEFYIYIAFAFFVVLYLVRKYQPRYGLITFFLGFWIFYDDVGNKTEFKISLPGFDLQPMRMLFLICLVFLFTKPFIDKYRQGKNSFAISVKPTYETFLWVFLVIATVSYIINFGYLGPANFYIEVTILFRFLVIYYTVRTIADEGTYFVIRDTIIVVCVVSSLVAFAQYADQSFFRVNPNYARSAFAGLIRATGVFRDDYLHSYIVFTGLVWVYFTMSAGTKKSLLIALFLASIFIAFMRMGYVVTTLMLGHAFYFKTPASGKLKVLVTTMSVIVLIFVGFWVITSGILDSSVAQERMLDEGTMELRFELYEKAMEESVESTKAFLFGYGSKDNPAYGEAMYEVTRSELWASGVKGGWHNLYIQFLYFNGFPAMVAFMLFMYQFIRYFYFLEKRTLNEFYLVPFYCAAGYAFANLTLSLTLYTNFAIVLSMTAALAVWVREQEVNQQTKYEGKNIPQ